MDGNSTTGLSFMDLTCLDAAQTIISKNQPGNDNIDRPREPTYDRLMTDDAAVPDMVPSPGGSPSRRPATRGKLKNQRFFFLGSVLKFKLT